MSKYAKDLLNFASKLDAMIDDHGEISKIVSAIVNDEQGITATLNLLNKISNIADSNQYSKEVKIIANTLKNSLIQFYGYQRILEICNQNIDNSEEEKSLPELLQELNNLIGLDNIKAKVNDLIIYQKVQKLRKKQQLNTATSTMHLAFMGNPGTGKTTVARIVGRIYKQLGLLSRGHFVEVSRADLIAGYQGQTALKVKEVIKKAKGGVLFIDEAYSITENDQSDSYGRECLTELTKALEDYRNDLVVIVAGYTKPMTKFFDTNLGLKSRFNTFIEFEDYSSSELGNILESMLKENDYILDDKVKDKVQTFLSVLVQDKDENFANGRIIRNLYDDITMNHARRIIIIEDPSRNDLSMIKESDLNF